MSERRVIDAAVLHRFLNQVFIKAGVPSADAAILAEVFVEADLRGIHPQGASAVVRAPGFARMLKSGQINPRPNISIVRESPLHALVDGDNGMGELVSKRAMEICISKARESGLGVVGARRSNHMGVGAYYPMMALKYDLIGFCVTNTYRLMAPPGGITPVVGNNPIAFAIPAGKHFPVVLDMALSVVAGSRITMALQEGVKIPIEWGLDSQGRPTDDPEVAKGSGLLPPIGGYKGFNLALVMDFLCGVMTGALFGRDLPRDGGQGHLFFALDPQLFMPLEEFKARADALIEQVKSSELAPGSDRVYLPGEIEWLNRERNLREGIALPPSVWEAVDRTAAEEGIDLV